MIDVSKLGPPLRVVQTNELGVCAHSDVIHHLEYDYYSRRLAVVSSDKCVSVYTKLPHHRGWAKTGQFQVPGGATLRVKWANPIFGQVLATASFDGKIYIFSENVKFNSTYDYQETSVEDRSLINCQWEQRSEIVSNPPVGVTDICFTPHYFGLLLGATTMDGYVVVYESSNPKSLDCWVQTMRLGVFNVRCRALAFSTDRFNTLLMAACTDDDRARPNEQIAVFPFARNCEQGVESPPITFICPTAGSNVQLPPTDIEFSPTGACDYQRLAIAIGNCIVIYHIASIPLERIRSPDSPKSTGSESSAETIIHAPAISITSAPRSEEELDCTFDDTLSLGDGSSRRDKRRMVHFNMDYASAKLAGLKIQRSSKSSPLSSDDPPLASESQQLNDDFINRIRDVQRTKESTIETEISTSNDVYVEATDADSETSESPSRRSQQQATQVQTSPSPNKRNDTIDTPISTASRYMRSIFGDDDHSILHPKTTKQATPDRDDSETTLKLELARKLELSKKASDQGASKSKSKAKPNKKKRKDDDDSRLDSLSTSSNDSTSKSGSSALKTMKRLTQNMMGRHSTKHSKQATVAEFHSVDGRYESATIHSVPMTDSGRPIPTKHQNYNDEEEEQVGIVHMRKCVLRAGRAQVKRISFNYTGSLITGVYSDGRVRVWKRINPEVWHCESVIEPPIVKGKDDIEVTSEKVHH